MEEHTLERHTALETESQVPSSGWRTRSDAWELLFFALKQLISQPEGPTAEALKQDVQRSLRTLYALELYWARPRRSVVTEIHELVDMDGTYAKWMGDKNIKHVLLRPDYYVAATANSEDELRSSFDSVMKSMTATIAALQSVRKYVRPGFARASRILCDSTVVERFAIAMFTRAD